MNPPPPLVPDLRRYLLEGVRRFTERASRLPGVVSIFLVGSLTTAKENPKDADLLVEITAETDLAPLAEAGRKLAGYAQQVNRGADIFLSREGRYLGRTCHYKEVFHRARCGKLMCVRERPHLCDTSRVLSRTDELVKDPPVRLWPGFQAPGTCPEDVRQVLGAKA